MPQRQCLVKALPALHASKACLCAENEVQEDVTHEVWGYLVHFKSTGKLLLMVMLPRATALHNMRRHPVFQYMQQQPDRHVTDCWGAYAPHC